MPDPLPQNENQEDVQDAVAILRFFRFIGHVWSKLWRKENIIPALLILILMERGIPGVLAFASKYVPGITTEAKASSPAMPIGPPSPPLPGNRMDRLEQRQTDFEKEQKKMGTDIKKILKALEVE